ncbi:hypothetical protein OG21DRAFT_1199866 [Imleria badia]|nr:hypothetical protein OG21DRAFT_1199866 [Imleria badia]
MNWSFGLYTTRVSASPYFHPSKLTTQKSLLVQTRRVRATTSSRPHFHVRLSGPLQSHPSSTSHAQVRAPSNNSLKLFGDVISNPIIQTLMLTLLKVLVHPGKMTNALSALKTSSMRHVDHCWRLPFRSSSWVCESVGRRARKKAPDHGQFAIVDGLERLRALSVELLAHGTRRVRRPRPGARATVAKTLWMDSGRCISRIWSLDC